MPTSATELIVTRAFMGIGAALIMPATLSILTNVFTDPEERARAIGIWAAVAGAGSALGPLLGGFLLQHFWWGSVFLVNVPVVIVAIVLGRLPAARPRRTRPRPASTRSAPCCRSSAWSPCSGAIIEAPVEGLDRPVGRRRLRRRRCSCWPASSCWELHTDHPMLDVRFFKNPRFTAANAAITLIFFAMFGSMFLITQYLQTVLGYSALEAGVRMLPDGRRS